MKNNIMGDTDDILMLTLRSRGEPFVGKAGGVPIESQTAEVVWYLYPTRTVLTNDTSLPPKHIQLYKLCRRTLLVYPSATANASWLDFFSLNDVSAHFDTTTNAFVGNTLGDLTKPENRYSHVKLGSGPTGYPYGVFLPLPAVAEPPPAATPPTLFPLSIASGRSGEDVILDNVVSFNIQAYDPGAPVYGVYDNSTSPPTLNVLAPGETHPTRYPFPSNTDILSYGAYADLGYKPSAYTTAPGSPEALFYNLPPTPHQRNWSTVLDPVPSSYGINTYDTFSLHYENNGVSEDGDAPIDEGTNGLDDNNDGAVDDPGEYETQPPYPHRLRGLQVKIRVYEPDSRQVREVTVVQDFLPQ